ncbi:hypothetical protein N8Z76_00410 [Gammaproteobacteria bacterium]|nr:hypothetical protein [Gammaproteobacteria bacterium]
MTQTSLDFTVYPTTPGYKEKGGTSEQAANDMRANASTLRRKAYALLKEYPMTADETAEKMGEDILSIRPRLSELFQMGAIEKTMKRRASSRGKSSIVWKCIDETS